MNIIQIIREEIERFEWGKDMVAGEEIRPNRFVYHMSDPKNRESIAQRGLEPKVGDSYSSWSGGKKAIPAIFATNSTYNEITGGLSNFHDYSDLWEIDTTKIYNKWYEDKHFSSFKEHGLANPHIVTFERILPEAIRLVKK